MISLVIMCGYPYAGKTTLARQMESRLGFSRITVDDVLVDLGYSLEGPFSEADWQVIYTQAEEILKKLLAGGFSVIFDATNFTRGYRDKLRSIADSYQTRSIVVFVDTPVETIRERDRDRLDRHKAVDLDETIREFEPPAVDENVYVFSPDQAVDEVVHQICTAGD